MKPCLLGLITALVWYGGGFSVYPCTTFVLEGRGRVYFGRNLDWDWEQGMVVINPRDLRKTAFVVEQNPAKWTSKYGSVTFNQFGREMPFGGMNEAGLVVENMWLDGTQYPPPDSRPEINMLQWIQYQLDNCATVEEVVATDKKIRLEKTNVRARIHYFVCDATGDCATIEFLDGAMQVHRGKSLPHRALANDTYEWASAYLRAHPAKKGDSTPLANTSSAVRFCRAAEQAAEFKVAASPEQDVTYAFDTLDQVRQGDYTVWQIVYDISNRRIEFRTRSNPKTRRIDLKPLKFDCHLPDQFVDIQADPSRTGALPFQELTPTENRSYLERFLGQDSLKQSLGDLTGMIEPVQLTLRSYTCADK